MNLKRTLNIFTVIAIPFLFLVLLFIVSMPQSKAIRVSQPDDDYYVIPVQSYQEYFAAPKGEYKPILPVSLTPKSENGYLIKDGVYISNQSGAKLDINNIAVSLPKFQEDQPQVLVIHSHATESFSPEGATEYDTSVENRSDDNTLNMVAVGDEFTRVLQDAGINVLHDTNQYDNPSYGTAYKKSGEAVKKYLEKYPSIRIVLDLHRDAIITDDLSKYRPIVNVGGKDVAQVMFVVGTNQNGQKHNKWNSNLALAVKWQAIIEENSPGIARPIVIRKSAYNQQLSTGSLLLEIGASGNSLKEAVMSARLCAKSLVSLLNKYN